MPNIDSPSGFKPLRHAFGGTIRSSKYQIASGYATAIYTYDAVVLTSGDLAIAADDSATLLGVFAGCNYRKATGEVVFSPYWPAAETTLGSVAVEALVWDDPGIIYRTQSDTGTAYVHATHKGAVCDLEKDHAGSAVTGQSGMELDLADVGTGQFLILGLIDEPGNAVGVNAQLAVMIKKSLLKGN